MLCSWSAMFFCFLWVGFIETNCLYLFNSYISLNLQNKILIKRTQNCIFYKSKNKDGKHNHTAINDFTISQLHSGLSLIHI